MDNHKSDKNNQQFDDKVSKSSHESNTQDSQNNQNSQDSTSEAFNFSSFGQQYLDQLNQVNQFNQSLFDQSNQASNPFEANMKLWQNSINNFGNFMMPNVTGNADSHKSDSRQDDKNKDQQSADNDMGDLNELSQKFFSETLKRVGQDDNISQSLMLNMIDGWQKFSTGVADKSPTALIEQQMNLWKQQFQLYQNTLMKGSEDQTQPLVTPEKGDKRFTDEEWTNNPIFDFLKQSYLLTANGMMDTIDNTEGVDEKTRQRLSFFTRQWLNAMAPSNFLWSNPEILRLTMESKGQNLVRGLKQLTEDMEKSSKMLSIRMTDHDAFKLGENIATTTGKVVFRNRLFELIQYNPTTAKVKKRPLLIVPPWINKFYIMDLKEKNSYIRWALNEGHSVFVMSWANPTQAYKDVDMKDYMHEGLLTALDVIEEITGESAANVIGYCIGGMLLALTLSWLTENKQADRIASATFWATIFDFSDPGDLGVFIDERTVSALEQEGEQKGVFDGRLMGAAFSLLRENSLYWNYYVQNYLKGERPIPFDLLYWNSDATNVTAALHSFVLRELYLGNKMIKKGELSYDGVKIDLSKVTIPTYVVATLQDHIAKWKGSYASTQVLGGDVTFVLGESGHIAGIINPPTGKYGFYTHEDYVADPDEWYAKAKKHDKSWWLHWSEWIDKHSAGEVDSRQPGVQHTGKEWQLLSDAPGEYVHVRADEALRSMNS
ncbi:class I poly(R)-hydroxyalkanoic acid synthase [uncultured Psychrobacter sp.]|uniref:class I poly(R)-hydroxyalkanoic acid synthase n=1 Tax=uncultured Psychrobacter sp. TaxID=259303 RepID=UPI002622433D|nr:class I poly(R)-hydroxyalkanoic acid synthase [uncultured Psychrobacter sp.]